MAAHSPVSNQPDSDYEDRWRALHRLIHGTGSLSGREANVFYLNLGNGQFVDISGVTGLDFIGDGRAYSMIDLDNDGDLDIILKSRNAPQLRILRNETESGNHSIAFQLIGRQSNRDAVGAVVTLETAAGQRTKEVVLGSGYLSQSTKILYFGVGELNRIEQATISWPSGQKQTLHALPIDHRITVTEGEDNFTAVPFRSRNSDQRVCPPQSPPPPRSPPEGIAMLNPVPLLPFALKNLRGETVTHASLTGRPTVLNFWATWCVPCQTEMKLWKEHYQQIRTAGAEIVAISVDEPDDRGKVEQFVRERGLPFPILLMDASTLEHFNLFYHLLFPRSSDLQIPTTMLLNGKAELVKIYLGVVPMEVLLKDLDDLKNASYRLAQAALPYRGRRWGTPFFRDYYSMSTSFFERGLMEESGFYLERAVEDFPTNGKYWDKLGVVYARQGQLGRALAALRRSVEVRPDYADGYFNLGVAYQRLGRLTEAEQAFARAAKLDPADARKQLHYQMVLAQNGKGEDPIKVLERYLESEPQDAKAHTNLGALYLQRGLRRLALERFEKATDLDPDFALAWRNLGIAYLQQRMLSQATNALERAVALDAQDAAAFYALADAYDRSERIADSVRMLERVLELQPDHPRARKILQQLRQKP